MVQHEGRAVISLAIIMACRMLGLFMILPFFSVYAATLPHATPFLIGVALGAYGLTQACFQLPLGSLSDKIGRKRAISIGLIVFALGSAIAALSSSIYGIILGRALQGAGAVGSTILAMAADLTRDENRSKAMAMLGFTIGLAFFVALIAGPLMNQWIHLSGIFWTIFSLALLSLVLLHTVVPNPPLLLTTPEKQKAPRWMDLRNTELLRLNFGIFNLHAMLTATFIALPVLLTQGLHLPQSRQTSLYLIILFLAFLLMLPFMILAEKKREMRRTFIGAIVLLTFAEGLMAYLQTSLLIIALCLLGFFTAFTLLEATLPSMVSKIAPIQRKGTAMGIYSTAQFLGIFVGGTLGGVIFSHFALSGLFLLSAVLGIVWLLVAIPMKEPPYLSTFIFRTQATKEHHSLQNLAGVAEVATLAEGLLYIKADAKIISREQLRKLIDESNLRQ